MINTLKDRIEGLEKKMELSPLSVRIVEVKEMTVEEAKKKILEFYEEHDDEAIYPGLQYVKELISKKSMLTGHRKPPKNLT
jgi:hypothetical protein